VIISVGGAQGLFGHFVLLEKDAGSGQAVVGTSGKQDMAAPRDKGRGQAGIAVSSFLEKG
jgi:hypothetical protein